MKVKISLNLLIEKGESKLDPALGIEIAGEKDAVPMVFFGKDREDEREVQFHVTIPKHLIMWNKLEGEGKNV